MWSTTWAYSCTELPFTMSCSPGPLYWYISLLNYFKIFIFLYCIIVLPSQDIILQWSLYTKLSCAWHLFTTQAFVQKSYLLVFTFDVFVFVFVFVLWGKDSICWQNIEIIWIPYLVSLLLTILFWCVLFSVFKVSEDQIFNIIGTELFPVFHVFFGVFISLISSLESFRDKSS